MTTTRHRVWRVRGCVCFSCTTQLEPDFAAEGEPCDCGRSAFFFCHAIGVDSSVNMFALALACKL